MQLPKELNTDRSTNWYNQWNEAQRHRSTICEGQMISTDDRKIMKLPVVLHNLKWVLLNSPPCIIHDWNKHSNKTFLTSSFQCLINVLFLLRRRSSFTQSIFTYWMNLHRTFLSIQNLRPWVSRRCQRVCWKLADHNARSSFALNISFHAKSIMIINWIALQRSTAIKTFQW